MSRILHLVACESLSGCLSTSGTQWAATQLVHHARQCRHKVILAAFEDRNEPSEILSAARRQGVETIAVHGGERPGLLDDLAESLRWHDIDLICTHGWKANVVGHFAAKRAGLNCVPFVYGWTAETEEESLYERLARSLILRSSWVVCASASQARELARLRRGRPAPVVIPRTVLSTKWTGRQYKVAARSGESAPDARAFVFGAAGRLNRDGGHRLLLDAFASLNAMLLHDRIELLLLGEGPEEAALRAHARRLGVERQVCFAGAQPRLDFWIKGMDCFVDPSPVEAVQKVEAVADPIVDPAVNSMLEAMFLGVPAIAASAGNALDIAQDGETALLVRSGSAAALAEAMRKMVCSPTLRRKLASAARYRAVRNFSPEGQNALLETLYENALGSASVLAAAGEAEHAVA